jgi:hypothetical protein
MSAKRGAYFVLLDGDLSDWIGGLVELKRTRNDSQVVIALANVTEKNTKGFYLGQIVWFSPGHLREFNMKLFTHAQVKAFKRISLKTDIESKESLVRKDDE